MKPFMRPARILVLAALVGVALTARAGGTTGTLAGFVLDAAGKPVANAAVTMQTSDGLRPHATRTDSRGHFEFVRFATGQYDLRAEAKGEFSDWAKRMVIRAGKTTEVTLRLPGSAVKPAAVKP
jgi:hypothetical protein